MPTKKRKGRARQPFRNGAAVRSAGPLQAGAGEGGEPPMTLPASISSVPLARVQRTVPAEPSKAMLVQHAQVARELRKIGLITGTIFFILIVLAFIVPAIT